jgi:hypothetical protein
MTAMLGLRKAFVLEKTELKPTPGDRSMMVTKRYLRCAWDDLKKGDVVVIVESDGTLLEDGIEHHLIEDVWIDPDIGFHVIKTLDPCRAIHKEKSHGKGADEAAEGVLPGPVEAGLQPGSGNNDRDYGGALQRVLAQAGGKSSTGGVEGDGI